MKIRHKPVAVADRQTSRSSADWMPVDPFTVGITAGASTPNNKIGETLVRLLKIRGIEVDLAIALEPA